MFINGLCATSMKKDACTQISIHYKYENYALAHGTGTATVKAGYDTWFFLTADYAFGHGLEEITSTFVRAGGGRVLGSVRVPINTLDFSSALLQAQSSKAKVVGLANAGADTINSIKQAAAFGVVRGGQKLAGLLGFINNVITLGLEVAQGMLLTNAFYWDRNEEAAEPEVSPAASFLGMPSLRGRRQPNAGFWHVAVDRVIMTEWPLSGQADVHGRMASPASVAASRHRPSPNKMHPRPLASVFQ